MKLTPITLNLSDYPTELRPLLGGAKLYDSSSSPTARVVFIDKDSGYFLKTSAKGTLEREAALTRYFHSKNLSAGVLAYNSDERDWLLTEKIPGDDCTAAKYLEQPVKLCDTIAELLLRLHSQDFSDCPVLHTPRYLERAENNYRAGVYDKTLFPDNWGYSSAEEAWGVIERGGSLLKSDTLLHGDYCLPNIILNDRSFSGFVDLDSGGVGDRHVDLFWGAWTLFFNLKTDKYRERFLDAYGRDKIDGEMLRVVAACEVFG
jgi:kanamycin kinase